MNTEYLLDAVGHIDDELILEAEERPARRRVPVWQVATAAAAAVVVCAGLYLLPAVQPAGMAAPEAEAQSTHNGVFGTFSDVMDAAGGILADGAVDDRYKYMTEQSTARAPSAADKGAAGETAGVFEPVFRTEQGRYVLVGEEFPLQSELPDDVRYLGELAFTAPDEPSYPSVGTKELVGRPVWQSEDGEYLYIQNPAGGWLQATRQQ
ncbi:MAG: hypothetical protein IJB75_03635 [Oscillospiraceae bacterium]|nr:hypothetical protein [Oscillospiraceae bacterium]